MTIRADIEYCPVDGTEYGRAVQRHVFLAPEGPGREILVIDAEALRAVLALMDDMCDPRIGLIVAREDGGLDVRQIVPGECRPAGLIGMLYGKRGQVRIALQDVATWQAQHLEMVDFADWPGG